MKIVELAMNNINGKTFFLGCPANSCKAKLCCQIRPPILVEVIDGKKRLTSSVTEGKLFRLPFIDILSSTVVVHDSQLKKMTVFVMLVIGESVPQQLN